MKASPRIAVERLERDELAPEDTPVTHIDALFGADTSPHASTSALDDAPTIALEVAIMPHTTTRTAAPEVPGAPAATRLDAVLAHIAKLWRNGLLRTAAIVAGTVVITYLALGGARRDSDNRRQTVLVPAPARPAVVRIIVEQLNGALQPGGQAEAPPHDELSNKPGRRSASNRALETSLATAPAGKSGSDQVLAAAPAQAQPKSSRAERSSTTASSSSAALPAWGADDVRDFSTGKKNNAGTSGTGQPQALTGKPTSTTDMPPAAAPASSPHESQPAAPAVAAKPAEPSAPAAPPPPSKPLTMDQLLNRVEEAAQKDRKEAGLKAPKARKGDAELDELITGAIQSKK